MVPDEKTPRLRSMEMGNRTLVPCPNNYQCESCPTEANFLAEMKTVITEFRRTYGRFTEKK
jgi:hypothetical protein